MNDIKIPHEYRQTLRTLRQIHGPDREGKCDGSVTDLLDRLIAAAEADQPPLPEGWVLLDTTRGRRALWHEDGALYEHDMLGDGVWAAVAEVEQRDRLTPLRPTITEAQIKAAAEDCLCEPSTIRQHLAAVGIEVAK